jgi:hypothetical protein
MSEQDHKKNKGIAQHQIARVYSKYLQQKQTVLDINIKLIEQRESLPEYDNYNNLNGQLEVARVALTQAEASNRDINDLKDSRVKEYRELNQISDELSRLLVDFISKYGQRSIDLDPEFREIKVKASIGKKLDKQEVLPL